jgi:hypothetical protein
MQAVAYYQQERSFGVKHGSGADEDKLISELDLRKILNQYIYGKTIDGVELLDVFIY